MALLYVNFFSSSLHRKVPMQVILPTDTWNESKEPLKTLYLLHGLTDNCTAWTSNTRIEHWACERNLAVVMPSGENAFRQQLLWRLWSLRWSRADRDHKKNVSLVVQTRGHLYRRAFHGRIWCAQKRAKILRNFRLYCLLIWSNSHF